MLRSGVFETAAGPTLHPPERGQIGTEVAFLSSLEASLDVMLDVVPVQNITPAVIAPRPELQVLDALSLFCAVIDRGVLGTSSSTFDTCCTEITKARRRLYPPSTEPEHKPSSTLTTAISQQLSAPSTHLHGPIRTKTTTQRQTSALTAVTNQPSKHPVAMCLPEPMTFHAVLRQPWEIQQAWLRSTESELRSLIVDNKTFDTLTLFAPSDPRSKH